MKNVGIFYGPMEYSAIGYFYGQFGKNIPVLVCCAKKNLANLVVRHK
jgi:hypothetical protein